MEGKRKHLLASNLSEASRLSPPRRSPGRGSKAETQRRILDAARELFAARGFDGASVAAIAAHAGVSSSAVFWHFGDKESLFRETFRRMLEPFLQEIQATFLHIDSRQRVYELVLAYERVVDAHESTIRTIVRWLLESERLRTLALDSLFQLHGRFVRDVREAFESLVSDPQEASELAAAVVSLLDGNLLLSMLDPSPQTRELRHAGVRRVVERLLPDSDGH